MAVAVDVVVVVAIVIAEDSGVVVAKVAGVLSLLGAFTDIRRGVFSPRRLSSLEDEFEVDTIVLRVDMACFEKKAVS